MMSPQPNKLIGRLALETELGPFLGATRIRLLEAIDAHGSISQAAKAVPLSYKAAWDAVDAMNNLAHEPLVLRSTGGARGGGTRLTDYGRKVIALYRAVEQEYQGALDRLAGQMQALNADDVHQFQTLLRRMAVRTSARNQFVGTVAGLHDGGGVDFEVRIALDAQTELTALITRASADNLGLALGQEVVALVKSSSLLLCTAGVGLLSARNQLWGEVSHIHEGPVSAEVALALAGGKTVTAVLTRTSVENLGLAPGLRACAVFKASSVILAALG